MQRHGLLLIIGASALLPVTSLRAQCTNCPPGQSGQIQVARVPLGGGAPEILLCRNAGADFTTLKCVGLLTPADVPVADWEYNLYLGP